MSSVLGKVSHTWKKASDLVYATPIPKRDWVCTSCGARVCAEFPPLEECPVVFQRRVNERLF